MVLKFAMQEPELEPLIHNEMLACPRAVPERRLKPHPNQLLKCPRCDSSNTKFCYYNNYSLTQPRHFCKACRRYWTKGGALRNVPVGGGCRKNKRSKQKTADQQGAGVSSSKPSTITVPSTLSGENSFSSGHGSPSTPLSQSLLRNSSAAAYLTYSVDEDDGGRYALDATGKMQHISRLEETDLSGNQTMLSPELGSNLAILTGGDTSNLYSFLSGMLSADALPSLDGGVVGLNNYPSYGVSAKGDTGLLSSCDAVQTLGTMAHEVNGSCSTSDGSGNGAYINRASYDLPWNLYHQQKLGAQFNGVQSTEGQHLRRVGEDRATENLGVVKDEFSSNITGHSLFAEGSSGAHRPLDWQLPSDGYFETAGDLCVLPGGNWPDLTLYGSGSGTLS